jgi:hypothetical protein
MINTHTETTNPALDNVEATILKSTQKPAEGPIQLGIYVVLGASLLMGWREFAVLLTLVLIPLSLLTEFVYRFMWVRRVHRLGFMKAIAGPTLWHGWLAILILWLYWAGK